ncbi:MAG: lipoprotein [Hydrocarboniphaga effusa]|nr:lipoprotein [Hydrocarboniphaga effusa]
MRTAALAFLLLLSACGQSGDLYLPSEPAPASEAPPVPLGDVPPAEKPEEEKKPEAERAP